jgi:hypothetical protein
MGVSPVVVESLKWYQRFLLLMSDLLGRLQLNIVPIRANSLRINAQLCTSVMWFIFLTCREKIHLVRKYICTCTTWKRVGFYYFTWIMITWVIAVSVTCARISVCFSLVLQKNYHMWEEKPGPRGSWPPPHVFCNQWNPPLGPTTHTTYDK